MVAMARRLDTKPTIIGENLLRLRAERRMTQEQLAEKADLSRLSISNIERGETAEPGAVTIAALAKALGVSPDDLLRAPRASQQPASTTSEPRMSLDAFLSLARGVLEREDVRRLELLRTRLDPRGLTKRAWLRTVIDLREDDSDDDGMGGEGGTSR